MHDKLSAPQQGERIARLLFAIRLISRPQCGALLALTEAHMMRHPQVLEVDEDKMTARVQAGSKIYALMQQLALHGLAIPTTGTVAVQTLGGAISTGVPTIACHDD